MPRTAAPPLHHKVQVWIHTDTHVLLLKLVPDRGSDWQPVTGGVDPGEALATAAWREAREETGIPASLKPTKHLRDLHLSHDFQSRWGNPARDHAFSIKLSDRFDVRTDPKEHVDHEWVEWKSADARLRWDFQKQVLKKLIQEKSVKILTLAFVTFGILTHSLPALAAQKALVTQDGARVYSSPNPQSEAIGTLPIDSSVEVSSKVRKSRSSGTWRKVRLSDGRMGYTNGDALRVLSKEEELQQAGLQSKELLAIESEEHGKWAFSARASGTIGYLHNPKFFLMGGEMEMNSILSFNKRGYDRRAWALGGFLGFFGNIRATGVSLIYRYFSPTRIEPEFRLRAGYDFHFQGLLVGACYGLRYPFSTVQRAHWSAILEGQIYTLYGESTDSRGGVANVIAGVGYHF